MALSTRSETPAGDAAPSPDPAASELDEMPVSADPASGDLQPDGAGQEPDGVHAHPRPRERVGPPPVDHELQPGPFGGPTGRLGLRDDGARAAQAGAASGQDATWVATDADVAVEEQHVMPASC